MMTARFKAFFSITLVTLVTLSQASGQEPVATDTLEQPQGRAAQLTLDDLRAFTDVFNQARKNYVEVVDDQTLLNAAIRGMLQELDPHSSYLPVKELSDLNDSAMGRYSGIGIEVRNSEGRVVVNAIINDSPADQAGINPGDVITAMDAIRASCTQRFICLADAATADRWE